MADLAVIELQESDDAAIVLDQLSWLNSGRVVLVVSWRASFPSRPLDFELLRRESDRRQLEIAIVSRDPERRAVARRFGFATFVAVSDAELTQVWRTHRVAPIEAPPVHWWEPTVELQPRAVRPRATWVHWLSIGGRIGVFLLAVAVLVGAGYVVIPHASITLIPDGQQFEVIVPVSMDPDAEVTDTGRALVPAKRVGVEIEGYLEVSTTGIAEIATGRGSGEVLFTNVLSQQYLVAARTVVRTSSTSYPVRFRTTADVAVPAGGQATVPIEGLQEGQGNVGAFQINRVEGVAASAVRVTNPTPTGGAGAQETHVVSQADYDRAFRLLTQQLLDQAFVDMMGLLEPTEVLLRQSLRVQAVPKQAYTRFLAEEADTVGLSLRLLVTGWVFDVDDAEGVGYSRLAQQLPEGYMLVDAGFSLGEVAEEDIGIGTYTVFVTARGYASQGIDPRSAVDLIRGRPVDEVRAQLMAELPLAAEPRIEIWPEWIDRMPLIPIRISVEIIPEEDAALLALAD
ncbi:MAG: hypothetical protein MUQ10_17990 [Anaerolineae bacterium]|nr:hypothetical protein [Anaerolineae bacterium]